MTYWFVFYKGNILLKRYPDGRFSIPTDDDAISSITAHTEILNITPMSDGGNSKTFEAESEPSIEGYEMCGLRQSFYKLSAEEYQKAGKAEELVYWYKSTRYCGVCGAEMEMHTDISKRCTNCGKTAWPQLSTAIIVLISRGDDLLLVHARNFKADFYGCIAGFVETGESLEEAVRREVKEETSIEIKNLRYFKSQPWPYPCGLMVGFFAEYENGKLKLQEEELSKGDWFNKDALPTLPEKLSLARMLIDHWLTEHKNK